MIAALSSFPIKLDVVDAEQFFGDLPRFLVGVQPLESRNDDCNLLVIIVPCARSY